MCVCRVGGCVCVGLGELCVCVCMVGGCVCRVGECV